MLLPLPLSSHHILLFIFSLYPHTNGVQIFRTCRLWNTYAPILLSYLYLSSSHTHTHTHTLTCSVDAMMTTATTTMIRVSYEPLRSNQSIAAHIVYHIVSYILALTKCSPFLVDLFNHTLHCLLLEMTPHTLDWYWLSSENARKRAKQSHRHTHILLAPSFCRWFGNIFGVSTGDETGAQKCNKKMRFEINRNGIAQKKRFSPSFSYSFSHRRVSSGSQESESSKLVIRRRKHTGECKRAHFTFSSFANLNSWPILHSVRLSCQTISMQSCLQSIIT